MNKLTFQIDKMTITVVNNSSKDIYVNVFASGDDDKYGYKEWYLCEANGGTISWARDHRQAVFVAREDSTGSPIETLLGRPGKSIIINDPK